jgi:leucyl-tRNA synthetase
MPQWAGSCWYYLRFIDPRNSERFCDPELERAWMPVDLYVGGAEHAVLHLLYARFWHKLLFDLGHVSTAEPFQHLYNQGMLNAPAFRNARGVLVPVDEVTEQDDGTAIRTLTGDVLERINAKMSKSLRNVVTPDEVIEEYGADTLRLYLMFMGPLDNQRFWDPKAISGIHRFLRRSWTLITGNADQGCREFVADEPEACTKSIHRAVKGVTADYESFSLNTAIAKLMEAINELQGQAMSRASAEKYVLLLAPLAPHLAEELWRRLGREDTLAYESWPEYDEAVLTEDSVTVIIQVLGKKRGQFEAARDADDATLQNLVIGVQQGSNYEVDDNDRFIVIRDKKDQSPKLVNVIAKR